MSRRYNSFGSRMKALFGTSVFKVNIDAGFTCPNRDGSKGYTGCIYCNNDSFSPDACTPKLPVAEQVQNGMAYLGRRYGARKFIAYFQPYTNTYAPVDVLERLYHEALSVPGVAGIAIGTRPDAVDAGKLDMIAGLKSDERFVLIEYGLQSVYEKSLRYINRGHGVAEFQTAVDGTLARGIEAGAHLIAGFPTETREEMLDMAEIVSATGVGFLKVHQLQIVRGTPLAEIYGQTPFDVFGYNEYVEFIVEFLERLSPDIVIQRLFATAPDDILIAPLWGMTRHQMLRDIEALLEERGTQQGRLYGALQKTH